MNERSTAPRKAVIYLRISQDREMDGLAIDRQREDCENLARFRRWEVVETYVDQSKSATDRIAIGTAARIGDSWGVRPRGSRRGS